MKKILNWLVCCAIATIFAGLVYVAVQQDIRMGANDPQIQMAQDIAVALSKNESPESLMPHVQVDIAASLAPFVIIYDDAGRPLTTQAELNHKTPVPPSGVFDYVRLHGEDRVTWQPRPDVRIAAVITRYTGTQSGFVLAGRSMREIEIRENRVSIMVLIAWMLIMLLLSFKVFFI